MFVEQPKIAKVSCLRACASRGRAQGGAPCGSPARRFRRSTSHLPRRLGRAATTSRPRCVPAAPPAPQRRRCPRRGARGPVSGAPGGDQPPRGPGRCRILPGAPPEPNAELTPVPGPRQRGAPRLETGTSRTKAFLGARRAVDLLLPDLRRPPVRSQVELVRASDGAVVRSVDARRRRGRRAEGALERQGGPRQARRGGRYSFRLTVAGADGAPARRAAGRRLHPRLPSTSTTTSSPSAGATTTAARARASARAAPATAIRARTCSPAAAPGWSPPAAAG